MNIITVDFETAYTADLGFAKQTTEEYIRDPLFEVVGVAVQLNSEEPEWFSGTMAEIAAWLNKYDWGNSLALAHNAPFDGAILSWHFNIKPKGWLDTLSMGRALHGTNVGGSLSVLAHYYDIGVKGDEVVAAKGLFRTDFSTEQLARYGEYCKNDVRLTWRLFNAMSVGFPAQEFKLIDLTVRMFTEPLLRLDLSVLQGHLHAVQKAKEAALGSFSREDLMSNPKFAELLLALGVQPPMKTSVTTGKQTYAFAKTDEGFLALLEHEDPRVQTLVSARLGTKSTIEESRTERFINIANRGAMPVPLRYYAAHTGRWGGDDKLNLQNLPRKSQLKKAIVAPEGYLLIDSDSSQIEARMLAWLAGQDDLVDAFEKGQDVYKIMASAIYRKPVNDVSDDERFVGKTTILGCGYGMGATRFQAQLKISGVDMGLEEAKRVINTYRETYPRITELWNNAQSIIPALVGNHFTTIGRGDILKVEGAKGVLLPNGLYLRYPNIRRVTREEDGKPEFVYDTRRGKATIPNRIYGGKLVENFCQALARIVIGEQMLTISKKYKVVMTVHDAVACVVPESEVETAKEYVELCMRLRPRWALELPLDCGAGYGRSYGDC